MHKVSPLLHTAEETGGGPARPRVFITPETGSEAFGAVGEGARDGAGHLVALPGCVRAMSVRPSSPFSHQAAQRPHSSRTSVKSHSVWVLQRWPAVPQHRGDRWWWAGGAPRNPQVEGTLGWA